MIGKKVVEDFGQIFVKSSCWPTSSPDWAQVLNVMVRLSHFPDLIQPKVLKNASNSLGILHLGKKKVRSLYCKFVSIWDFVGVTRAQCYKTYLFRNLRILVISWVFMPVKLFQPSLSNSVAQYVSP
jgi:hypothetical protein